MRGHKRPRGVWHYRSRSTSTRQSTKSGVPRWRLIASFVEEEGPRLSLGGRSELAQRDRRCGGHPSKATSIRSLSMKKGLRARTPEVCHHEGQDVWRKWEVSVEGMGESAVWIQVVKNLRNWRTEF